MPPAFSEATVLAFVDDYFNCDESRCSFCHGPVEVHESQFMGSPAQHLTFVCRRCSAHGQHRPDSPVVGWSTGQKREIVEQYWDDGIANCPVDQSVLVVDEARAMNFPTYLIVRCERCGRHFSSRDIVEENAVETFNERYDLLERIGGGAFGDVHWVQDRKLGKKLVVKTIHDHHLRIVEIVRRFQREVRLLSAIDHPNVVKIVDHFLDESPPRILMEPLIGGDFTEAINDIDHVPIDQLVTWFAQLCSGVSALHDEGIIHRDLKPDNALVGSDGVLRVSDLGLAVLMKRDSTTLTKAGGGLGTPLYMAPEQRSDAANAGPEADVWAMALIAYEAAIRRSPHLHVNVTRVGYPLRSVLEDVFNAETPAQRTTSLEDLANGVRMTLTPAGTRPTDLNWLEKRRAQALTTQEEHVKAINTMATHRERFVARTRELFGDLAATASALGMKVTQMDDKSLVDEIPEKRPTFTASGDLLIEHAHKKLWLMPRNFQQNLLPPAYSGIEIGTHSTRPFKELFYDETRDEIVYWPPGVVNSRGLVPVTPEWLLDTVFALVSDQEAAEEQVLEVLRELLPDLEFEAESDGGVREIRLVDSGDWWFRVVVRGEEAAIHPETLSHPEPAVPKRCHIRQGRPAFKEAVLAALEDVGVRPTQNPSTLTGDGGRRRE